MFWNKSTSRNSDIFSTIKLISIELIIILFIIESSADAWIVSLKSDTDQRQNSYWTKISIDSFVEEWFQQGTKCRTCNMCSLSLTVASLERRLSLKIIII